MDAAVVSSSDVVALSGPAEVDPSLSVVAKGLSLL